MRSMRSGIDWVGIEASYRTGQLPNLEIARRNGVTEGSIRYRAKRQCWQKDLSPEYQAGVKAAVLRKQYDSSPIARKDRKGSTEQRAKDILAAAIAEGKEVVLKHQKLGRLLSDNSSALAELIRSKIETLRADPENADVGLLVALSRAHEAIVRATVNAVTIERQSRGLDDQPADPNAPPSIHLTYHRSELVLNNDAPQAAELAPAIEAP